jgi:hypothetical protein
MLPQPRGGMQNTRSESQLDGAAQSVRADVETAVQQTPDFEKSVAAGAELLGLWKGRQDASGAQINLMQRRKWEDGLWRAIQCPPHLVQIFRARGLQHPYEWQVACLHHQALRKGRNLVLSLPTAAGKSFISDFECVKALLGKKSGKCLIIQEHPAPALAMHSHPQEWCISHRASSMEWGTPESIRMPAVRGCWPSGWTRVVFTGLASPLTVWCLVRHSRMYL